ncbi:carbamoyltransferase family protein [Candidatus Pelagibacter sp.]|uniref:carbamoyltransferase family protein n=1 Tax=Candidatus Pelagibacter sp. TaxID=2024849 RepID=UPI003F86C39A
MNTIKILGISCYYHDSAVALLVDGEIQTAVQEERFTRKKNDSSFPVNSINYILKKNNINLYEIDHVVFYEKPFLKFTRLLETYLANAPSGFASFKKAIPIWVKNKLFQKKEIVDELKKIDINFKGKILFSEHHISHAASAFYPSPFEEALILTLDAVGEYTTSSIALGKGNKIIFKKKINYPHSLGMLYSAFTYYCGFKVNDGEYKLMGLAPFGEPKYYDKIMNNLIHVYEDGSFALNMKFFDFSTGLKMINKKFEKLFNRNTKKTDEKFDQFHMDIASSIQKVIEEIILKICKFYQKKYDQKNICLAGGVALNCVANGKILKSNIFKDIWIQPAAGDAGGSLGAAYAIWFDKLNNRRKVIDGKDSMKGSFLGPSYSDDEIKIHLDKIKASYDYLSNDELYNKVSDILINKGLIGWFQDAMEYGPRALGNRSIIAHPGFMDMQQKINMKIKFREGFRPFAPAVLCEETDKFFENNNNNSYMLIVTSIKKDLIENQEKLVKTKGFDKLEVRRSSLQAVTHVDYSARVQSVKKKQNEKFYNLINNFYKKTGIPMIVNTSFNINNEPLVCTIEDAYKCFMITDLDYLVCGNYLLDRKKQF